MVSIRPATLILVAVAVLVLAGFLEETNRSATITRGAVKDADSLERVLARNRTASRERSSAVAGTNPDDNREESGGASLTPQQFERFRPAPFALPDPVPVSPHHTWLEKERGAEAVAASAAARGWAFAWIQYNPAFDRERLRMEWSAHGVDVLGFGGDYARARVPASRSSIDSLASHSAVRGLGVRPAEEKVGADLVPADGATEGEIPVLITLFEEDPTGSWLAELEALGVVVGDWQPAWRAYSANVQANSLEAVASADFVVGIELVRVVRALLDTAVPAMGADHAREYDPLSRTFDGTVGSSVPVGIVDTGLNANHLDISSGRASICGASFQPDDTSGLGQDLWMDNSGHGTHVTGILAGTGTEQAEFAGMAPGVKDIRIAKVMDRLGSGDLVGVATGVRYLLRDTSCRWQGEESEAIKPLVVNFSLGSNALGDGRSASNRNLDAIVWEGSQLYALAAGNAGSAGVSSESTSKNVLSVGAVTDAGVVTGFSSHGPTADGRLAPHVVGTGSAVLSASGNARRAGYTRASGTSMAAPSVAGVAALLMDRDDAFRERPAYAKARLMASAVKPATLFGSREFPSDNTEGPGAFNHEYGLGLVSAGTALGDGPDDAWWHGGDHGTVAAGEVYEYVIEVPEDTARLDVVLTWIERRIELISRTTVMADLDLYIDRDGDCEEAACGEHASTSRIDNVEWVVVRSPAAGTYTLRIVAANGFADPVRAGIAWTAIAASDTPALTVTAQHSSVQVDSGDSFEIDLEIGVDAYVSSGTTIHLLCRGLSKSVCDAYTSRQWQQSTVARRDETTAEADGKMAAAIPLGEIQVGEEKEVALAVPRNVTTSSHTLYFQVSSWNAMADVVAIDVVVDGEENEALVEEPANDSTAAAQILEGETGETAIDVLLATRDPGEPMVRPDHASSGIKKFFWVSRSATDGYDSEMQPYARHGSLWYLIEAARTGPYRLAVKPSNGGNPTWVAVYDGDWASDETRVVAGPDKVEFIAEAGGAYLVQLWSDRPHRVPSRLVWDQHPHERPANDDFAERQMLTGVHGTARGTNYRATLEAFEFYGVTTLGATTWFTWSAPETGLYDLRIPTNFRAIAFGGADTSSLRRVSSVPDNRIFHFPAEAGRDYQIAVLDDGQRLISDYELTWRKRDRPYAHYPNDMITDAQLIEGVSGEVGPAYQYRRTVEPGEHELSGTGTAWWRWVAPADGRHVFTLQDARYEQLAVFTGASHDELEPVGDGGAVTVDALADQTYWLSVGLRDTSAFADYDLNQQEFRANTIRWGPVPSNDTPGQAEALAGSTGSASGNHTYAATSDDEPNDIQGHSSLWWRWDAPTTGWQRFELEDWESAGLRSQWEQSILAVYRRSDSDVLQLLATSDHSYRANGRAEATIEAQEGESYIVRVALRAVDLGPWSKETTLTYGPAATPHWLRNLGRVVEHGPQPGDVEDQELDAPMSLAVIGGDPERVVVATREDLAVYSEGTDEAVLTRTDTVPYATEDSETVDVLDHAILHWNEQASELHLVQEDGVFLARGLDGGSKYLERCSIEPECRHEPTQATTDASGNLYVVGRDCVEIHERTASCEFQQSQMLRAGGSGAVSALGGARSLAVEPDGERLFVASWHGLVDFVRGEDGEFSFQTFIDPRDLGTCVPGWRNSTVVLSGDGLLFMVGSHSPMVAAFRVPEAEDDDQALETLGVLPEFFLGDLNYCVVFAVRPSFFSHVPEPSVRRCVAATTYDTSVDLFCEEQAVTVQWDEDAEELFVYDWFQDEHSGRFGEYLRDGLRGPETRGIAQSVDGHRHYVLGQDDFGTLHVFARTLRTEEDTQSED